MNIPFGGADNALSLVFDDSLELSYRSSLSMAWGPNARSLSRIG